MAHKKGMGSTKNGRQTLLRVDLRGGFRFRRRGAGLLCFPAAGKKQAQSKNENLQYTDFFDNVHLDLQSAAIWQQKRKGKSLTAAVKRFLPGAALAA